MDLGESATSTTRTGWGGAVAKVFSRDFPVEVYSKARVKDLRESVTPTAGAELRAPEPRFLGSFNGAMRPLAKAEELIAMGRRREKRWVGATEG